MLASYLVPFVMAKVIDVAEVRKSGKPGVVDNDIKATELLHSFFNQAATVFGDSDVLGHLYQRQNRLAACKSL